MTMSWSRLLSNERLRRPGAEPQEGRSAFQQDIDRIVFSSAFRRLAHKTQVHPLSLNDHVHTRLTHSIEASSVGRSLGTIAGTAICSKNGARQFSPNTIGDVVQAACLAHDIGNPPFGHSGEEAIRQWFREGGAGGLSLDVSQIRDFENFDGNTQGFRILTNVENNWKAGGLQLTYATLGAYAKYTRASSVEGDGYPSGKKIGFFKSELPYAIEMAQHLGLPERVAEKAFWCRHPLAFLVEAADDICYSIIDIEDGFEIGFLSFDEAKGILEPIADATYAALTPSEQIRKLRAVAIGNLVRECSSAFATNVQPLLDGAYSTALLDDTRYRDAVARAKQVAEQKLYWSESKTKLEIAGSEIIRGLMGTFSDVVRALEVVKFDRDKLTGTPQRLARLMGREIATATDTYEAMLCVTDFISAMTDRYALDLYRSLRGIAI